MLSLPHSVSKIVILYRNWKLYLCGGSSLGRNGAVGYHRRDLAGKEYVPLSGTLCTAFDTAPHEIVEWWEVDGGRKMTIRIITIVPIRDMIFSRTTFGPTNRGMRPGTIMPRITTFTITMGGHLNEENNNAGTSTP
jgi:hypothetical protein